VGKVDRVPSFLAVDNFVVIQNLKTERTLKLWGEVLISLQKTEVKA